jgi:hypothetical protein
MLLACPPACRDEPAAVVTVEVHGRDLDIDTDHLAAEGKSGPVLEHLATQNHQ